MRSQQRANSWYTAPGWLRLLGRNLPIALFLLLATGGMITVYWFFSPPEDGSAQAIASSDTLSAPIFKALPAKPVVQRLAQSPGPIRVGIISGHRGSDSGAVCADGLTEAEVNENIAAIVADNLRAQGIHTDILAEFDERLKTYGATAVVSIHADSCDYINELATGFKIAGSSFTDSSSLSICIEQAYQAATQLEYNANTITPHMTDYHAFRALPRGVPAIILEVGFLNLDRAILTDNAHVAADGITDGILCYIAQVKGQ